MTSLAADPSRIDHDPADGGGREGEPGSRSRPGGLRLWVHLGLLALALAAVVAVAKPDVSTWDEGSYGVQADALRQGGWGAPYRFDDLDPTGRWYPIIYSDRLEDGYATYARHPFLPSLQSALGRPLGRAGYLVPSVVGVLGAAACAWAIARRLRPGTEVVAFWVVGSGPLLFHATIIWAHAPGAALGGLAMLGAVLVRERRSSWVGHLAMAAAGAGVVLLRSEGLLFVLALLAAVGLDALLGPVARRGGEEPGPTSFGSRFATSVVSVLPTLVVVVATWLLEQRWIASILGSAGSPLEVRSTAEQRGYLEGRVEGLWASTLSGSNLDAWAPVLPLALLVVLGIVVARRRLARPKLVALAIGGYAVAVVLLQAMEPSMLVTGFAPGWPLVPIGVAACGAALWRDLRLPTMTVGITALAVWATQYPDGGVFQWGGRFLMVAAVPAAVVAAAGVRRLLEEASDADGIPVRQTAAAAAVVALAVVSAVAPVVALRANREQLADVLGAVEAASGPVAITTSEEMPRLMWRSDIEFLRVDEGEVAEVLALLREQGSGEVTLVAPEDVASGAAPAFGRIEAQAPVPRTDLVVSTLIA